MTLPTNTTLTAARCPRCGFVTTSITEADSHAVWGHPGDYVQPERVPVVPVGPIDIGADFPLTPEARATRERIAELLSNALYGICNDPIGGNVRHNVEHVLRLMDGES